MSDVQARLRQLPLCLRENSGTAPYVVLTHPGRFLTPNSREGLTGIMVPQLEPSVVDPTQAA